MFSFWKRPLKQIQKDALASCIVFPKTSSLKDDKPYETFDEDKKLDYPLLQRQVANSPTLVAISARDDVLLILQVLESVHDELLLDQFDYIQIYRGGIYLLRINTRKNCGRSAYVEISDYRRRLYQLLHPSYDNNYLSLLFAGLLGAAVTYYLTTTKKV